MLPLNATQLTYQDVGNTVWRHKSKIEEYAKQKGITFDLIVSKLRNGIHAGSIISTYLRLPFGVMEVNPADGTTSILWPNDINRENELNILVVDTVSNTGTSLYDMISGIKKEQPTANVHSYATFIAENNFFEPSIPGEIIKNYIQTPWEWLSYTPMSHLERLENNNDSVFSGREFFISVANHEILEKLEILKGRPFDVSKIRVYQNYAANNKIGRSQSGLSTLEMKDYRNKGIDVYSGPLKRTISEKVDFITKNGITHFIEDNLEEAIVLSDRCPVTHILYIEKQHLIRVFSHYTSVTSLGI